MSWFQNNHEGGHCDPFCPFVRDCQTCAFRGGESVAAQSDTARETGQEMGGSGMIKERPPVDPASTGSNGPGASPNRKPLSQSDWTYL
jgi:hypothetical protein